MPIDINAANWERLCEWMEPRPTFEEINDIAALCGKSARGWWGWHDDYESGDEIVTPRTQTLDACALAEAEIDRRGVWKAYGNAIVDRWQFAEPMVTWCVDYVIRLTPEQRAAAIIAVIEASHA